MAREELRSALAGIGQALRKPEDFAADWRRGAVRYGWMVWLGLILTSITGTLTYGMTMGILGGPARIFHSAFFLTVGAGLAWGIPLPALYILNSLAGSRLSLGQTFLAAIVTTSWGGLAMMASIPINWFFTAAIPTPWVVQIVNVVVFSGVGVSMIDVFSRVMERLEPERGRRPAWSLVLVSGIGCELFYAFGLFNFTAV